MMHLKDEERWGWVWEREDLAQKIQS